MSGWAAGVVRSRTCWLTLLPLAMSLLLGGAFWRPANLQDLVSALAIEGIMCVGMTIVMASKSPNIIPPRGASFYFLGNPVTQFLRDAAAGGSESARRRRTAAALPSVTRPATGSARRR